MRLEVLVATLGFLLLWEGSSCNSIRNSINEAWGYIKSRLQCIGPSVEPEAKDVQFFLFTQMNVNKPERIRNLRVNETRYFDSTADTKVLIHGFTQSYRNELFVALKNELLVNNIVNVIMVNWEKLASTPCYPVAADYTEFVGQLTAYLLKNLDPKRVHIIGFSLGAHVAGIAGNMQTTKVVRITGLDPAFPMFKNAPNTERLDKSDAWNVDIIHTSVLGYSRRRGHADFFVNGAAIQSGCKKSDVSCSHKKSVELYIHTVVCKDCLLGRLCDSQDSFDSLKCINNTVAKMGEPWLESGAPRGGFYLNVNTSEPNFDSVF